MGKTINNITDRIYCDHYRIDSWDEARNLILDLVYKDNTLVFRGHNNIDRVWELKTSFERKLKPQPSSFNLEEFTIYEFKRGAFEYFDNHAVPDSKFELLSRMQHYGAPTRLLDFTLSPFIAAFFAFEKELEADYASIWCVETGYIILNNFNVYNQIDDNFDLLKSVQGKLYDFKSTEDVDKLIASKRTGIIPAIPPKMDQRMINQQSIFLLPTNLSVPFIENFNVYYDSSNMSKQSPIIRIDIHKNQRLKAISELSLMGISSRMVYPGMEGFAKSIDWYIDRYKITGAFSDQFDFSKP